MCKNFPQTKSEVNELLGNVLAEMNNGARWTKDGAFVPTTNFHDWLKTAYFATLPELPRLPDPRED